MQFFYLVIENLKMQGNNIGYKIKQKLIKTQYADDFEHLYVHYKVFIFLQQLKLCTLALNARYSQKQRNFPLHLRNYFCVLFISLWRRAVPSTEQTKCGGTSRE